MAEAPISTHGPGSPPGVSSFDMLARRTFLQGLAVVAVSLALDPFRYVVTDGRHYKNVRLGISATLPAGWEFGSIADFASLRERTQLLDELEDELHPLKDPANLPVFVFEQPIDRERPFGAGILLYDEPLEELAPADEPWAHASMLEWLGLSYKDLVVIRAPEPIMLRGASATLSTWSYRHEIGNESEELLVRSVLVFRGDRVHTFYLGDLLTSPGISTTVWEEFIRSIHYSRRPSVA